MTFQQSRAFNGAVGTNATSAPLEKRGCTIVTVFGTSSVAAKLSLEVSADGSTWVQASIEGTAVTAHYFTVQTAARYVRVRTDTAATLDVWLVVSSA